MRPTVRFLTVVAAVFMAGQAYAASQDFTLVNKTGYQIDSVYVSKSSSDSWEEDVMGRDTLDDGETAHISFEKGARGCSYDLMVKYHDGDKSYWTNLDLCSISRIQLFWDRKAGTTRAVTE
jgi:hypothetical protein